MVPPPTKFKSTIVPPPLLLPLTEISKFCPPPLFVVHPIDFIFNIQVLPHPKCSTYVQLVCTN